MKEIERVPIRPFTRFCMSIGAVPSAYLAGLTMEEELLWLCSFLEKEVVPVVNNNSEVVEELKIYVEHYFDNLDVQEEINNKLDEMAEDGTLEDIIAAYLNTRAIIGFDTVNDMKSSENLVNGSYAKTLGYHSKNDGGSALYKIRNITNNDVINNKNIIKINDSNNQLIAELIDFGSINVDQLGAKGNNIDDDTEIFDFAVENYKEIELNSKKTYIVNELLINDVFVNINGNNATIKASNDCDYVIGFYAENPNTNNFYKGKIENLVIDGNHKANDCILNNNSTRRTFENITLNNPKENGFHATNAGGGTRLLSINGKQDNLGITSYFLKIDAADININQADYQGYKVGLYSSSNLQVNQFHGYIYPNNKNEYEGSKFIQLAGGRFSADNIYPDTQQFWIYISEIGDYHINNGFSWHNPGITDSIIEETTLGNEYVIFSENNTRNYLRRLHFTNFILSTPNTIENIKFCNIDFPFDTTSTNKSYDSNIDFERWLKVSIELTSAFGTVNTTNVSSSNLRVKTMNDCVGLFGSFSFSDAHTGENYVDIFTEGTNYKLLQNTSLSFHNCRIGTSINDATTSDVKLLIQDGKIRISKLQSTSLANKILYIDDCILLKNNG